jgi:peptide/nickel transport system permease protein
MSEPAVPAAEPAEPFPDAPPRELARKLLRNPAVLIGGMVLALLALIAVLAPLLGTTDPVMLDPGNRDLLPGVSGEVTTLTGETYPHTFWMGTDSYGRDIYSRVLYGGRVSLIVGVAVALLSLAIGMAIGLSAGYIRWLDSVVMRVMDGLMAIPGILLAIALVAMWRASLLTVILAVTIPEIPRVVRLVRSLVLTIREEPYVEAARSVGTSTLAMLYRHILPNTLAPLIVQGTYICASAILVEAILSFLGVGLPTDIPTWGNIMAEGRLQFQQFPHNVLLPGAFLAVTVLAVNMLGDGLRDTLDPRFNERGVRR